jgi:hypothetical protein
MDGKVSYVRGDLPGGHVMRDMPWLRPMITLHLLQHFCAAQLWWILSCSARTPCECERIRSLDGMIMYTKKGIKARGISASMAKY